MGRLTVERGELLGRIDNLEKEMVLSQSHNQQVMTTHSVEASSSDDVEEMVRHSMTAVEAELSEAKAAYQACTHEIAELKASLVHHQKEARVLQGSLQRELDNERTCNGQLTERLSALELVETKLIQTSSDYEALQGLYNSIVADHESLKGQYSSLIAEQSRESTELLDRMQGLQTSLSHSEETMLSLAGDKQDLLLKIDHLEGQLLHLRDNCVKDESSIDGLNRALKATNVELVDAKACIESCSQEIAELKASLVHHQNEHADALDHMQKDLEVARAQSEGFKKQYNDIKADHEQLKGQYNDIKADYEALKGQYSNVISELDNEKLQYQNTVQELSNQLNDRCAVVGKLETELRDLVLASTTSKEEEVGASVAQAEAMLHQMYSERSELLDRMQGLQTSLSHSEETVLSLAGDKQDLLLKIDHLERQLQHRSEENQLLEQQLYQRNVDVQSLNSDLLRYMDQAKHLAESLTSSEASLKAMEEVAWHAKAEASELLFALEQEKDAVNRIVVEKQRLDQQLFERQDELETLRAKFYAEIAATASELESAKSSLLKANHQLKLQSQE